MKDQYSETSKKHKKAIVIGSGISGLTSAYSLLKNGYVVTLLEKASHSGGTIVSEHKDGFTMDFGPNSGLDTSPYFHDMIRDIGIENKLLYASPKAKKRFILKNNQLNEMPTGPFALLGSSLFSFTGKWKIMTEPWVKPSTKRETVSEFVERRFGRDMLDYAVNPFISGIYAGNPDRLSVQEALPKLYALEERYGSVIKGAIKGAKERKQRKEKSKVSSRMFSFSGGMQTLTEGLTNYLQNNGANFQFHSTVNRILVNQQSKKGKYTLEYTKKNPEKIHKIQSDHIVLSVPADSAAHIIKPIDKEFSNLLNNIYYPAVLVLYVVFKSESVKKKNDGFGFLIPEKERMNFLGAIFSSTLFPVLSNNDSNQYKVYTIFAGGARKDISGYKQTDIDKEKNTILNELKEILLIDEDPLHIYSKLWPRAIPQYQMNHNEVLRSRERFEKKYKGLYIRGNYVDGISLSDCISAGFQKVEEIREYANEQ